jgi:dihydrofolate synthase / folylpolyglutamate synthase
MPPEVEAAYRAAQKWLFSLVRDPHGERFMLPRSLAERRTAMATGMARLADFLAFVGNPEQKTTAVQIAGTSGKGSVTMTMAALLRAIQPQSAIAHHTSPYLQEPLEKLVLNDQWLAPVAFAELVSRFRAQHEAWVAQAVQNGGQFADGLRYGEAWVGLTFYWLANTAVPIDIALIETGMGGRFDPTSLLPAQLSIISNIGWDHVGSLGPTLADIAWHKAGIIKPQQSVITGVTDPDLYAVIAREAAEKEAPLWALGREIGLERLGEGWMKISTPTRPWPPLPLPQGVGFQAENVALAVAGVDILAEKQGWQLDERAFTAVADCLRQLSLPGRMELVQAEPLILLDGAHNLPKMAALAQTMRATYPTHQITAVVGALVSKDVRGMLAELLPLCTAIVLTEPEVPGKPALPVAELAEVVAELAPMLPVVWAEGWDTAVFHAQQLSQNHPHPIILITGSIYLIGACRSQWYPNQQLLQHAHTHGHTLRPFR